jgi:Rieske Fe-S protein
MLNDMYILTYTQEGAAQVAVHLTDTTATAQAAALQATEGVTDVVKFGPVAATEAENDTDFRLSHKGDYLLQDRLRLAVLTRANYMFGWATANQAPEGETVPSASEAAAAKYAILNADQPGQWFPKIWENFIVTLKPERTTVAGIEAWVKANWPVFALLWADKL